MAIPINGRQVGFVPDLGIIVPPIDYGWREHCGAGHKWTESLADIPARQCDETEGWPSGLRHRS
jgi:hypothetical protein